jgi:glycosyltransferase involved in cell wall biosynthesis
MHLEKLCPLLAQPGCRVEALMRTPYVAAARDAAWRGVRIRRLWAPRSRGLEALAHSFLGVLYAAIRRPDVLHIHAIGPALMTPLARLFGLRVVVTHHGPDYERQKWGAVARWVLRTGEKYGMRHAHARIAISPVIGASVREHYAVECQVVPNGVDLPDMPATRFAPSTFGLEPQRYVLIVGRLVAEKRHLDLIEAFSGARLAGWKLAIVGAADHPDLYSERVLRAARDHPSVVCTGFQSGLALRELYAHAGVFVLPSSHEGLPIALLEALSFGLPVLASDIPANRAVGLPDSHYFPLGDTSALASRLAAVAAWPLTHAERERRRAWVARRFDWQDAANKTLAIYRAVVAGKRARSEPVLHQNPTRSVANHD